MSGAPVVFYERSGRVNMGSWQHTALEPVTVFHGIYSGREASESLFEAQIGTVWRRDLVEEVLASGVNPVPSEDLPIGPKAIRAAIEAQWPAESFEYASTLLAHSSIKSSFTSVVLEAIQGRASPTDIATTATEIARKKLATG